MDRKKTTRHLTEKSTRKHPSRTRRDLQGAVASGAKKVDSAKKPAAKLNSKWRNVRENISTISQQTGRPQEKLQIEVMYGENFGDGLTFPEITSTYDSFRPTAVQRRRPADAMLKRMRSVKLESARSAPENHQQDINEETEESMVEFLPPIEAPPLADIVEAEESPPPPPPVEEAAPVSERLSVRFDEDEEEEVFTEEDSQHIVRVLDIKNFSKSVDFGGRDEDSPKEDKKRFLSLPDLDIRGAFNLVQMNSLDGAESPKVSTRRSSLTEQRGETSSRVAGVRNLVRSLTEGNINSRLGVHSPMPDRLPKKDLPTRKFIQLENLANIIDTMDGHDSAIESLSDSMLSLEVSTIADDQFRCQDFVNETENCFAQYDPKTNEFTRLVTPNIQQKKERLSNRHLSRIAENADELLSIGTIDSACSRSSLRSSALDGMSESRSIQPQRLTFADLKKAAQSKVHRMNYLKSFETRTIRSQLSSSSMSGEPIEPIEWKQGKVIDRGAFGTVYQGLTNDAKLIAVKEVFFNKSKDIATQKLRLEKEIEILKGLQHPNIVRFQGTCSMEDRVQIFMNYVAGGTLSSLMDNFGPLSETVYKKFTQQIMSAVAYIHSKGVVHRDIKGANILIEPKGTVKLIDFGCSREMSLSRGGKDSSLMKSLKGTPFWMAPEVIRGTGCNHKSDIWSVGCTVIEMASGKPPWSEIYDNATAIMFAIGSGNVVDPILPEDSSEQARDFVAMCITRKMDERPSAEELLSHPFIDYRDQSLF